MADHPKFLTFEQVMKMHRDQIHRYGGEDGLRDQSSLLSAIAVPESGIEGSFFHHDLYEMASAYLFHIVRNHPFVDGNKRTAVVAALVFLDINSLEIRVDEDALVDLVLRVIAGEIAKSDIAEFFRERADPGT